MKKSYKTQDLIKSFNVLVTVSLSVQRIQRSNELNVHKFDNDRLKFQTFIAIS